MSEKMKESILYLVILASFSLVTVFTLNLGKPAPITPLPVVEADVATTSVVVGNATPTWQVIYEDPASSSSTPTNAESNVSFKGRADDPNGDNWYLIVCSTSTHVSTTSDGSCPTCAAGSITWATSSATDNNTTTATYTTSNSNEEKNDWWAWACDDASDEAQLCTSYSQGTGGTSEAYSPFVVNHRPVFDALTNNEPIDPDEVITWSTNTTTTDPDSYGGQDTIKLHICKTQEWTTTSDTCTGGYWSSSTVVTNNPSCDYDDPNNVIQDKTYYAYAWLVDNHGLEATGTIALGTASNYDVNNVTPSITAADIHLLDTDGTGNLELLYEGTTTPGFKVEATIIDYNSCEAAGGGNEISTSTAYVYRELIGYNNCSTTAGSNPNNCYPEISCTVGPCNGINDSDATTSCTFSLWFLAEPTVGSNSTDSTWWNEKWFASVKAIDDDGATATTEDSDGNELDKLEAYDLTTTNIPYGSVPPGSTSSEATTTIKATGNVGLDENVSGFNMEQVGDSNTIDIGQQHYSTTTGFLWTDGIVASSTEQELELNCQKSTSTSSPATKDTYWIIKVPGTQPSGTYNGTNTIAAITGEAQDW
jgi:hypothetical protein